MNQRLYSGDHPTVPQALNNLAKCLDALGRVDEAIGRRRESLAMQRRLLPPDSPVLASSLAQIGMAFIQVRTKEAASEAEPILRECLAIREKAYPEQHSENWLVYNTMSLLGGSLVGELTNATMPVELRQSKLGEAESLLLAANEKLQEDPHVPPPASGFDRKREAIERIVRLYEVWDKAEPGKGFDAKASQWRAKLLASDPAQSGFKETRPSD
jgi:tetratricopeptide (TPR) repeat protein